MALARILSVTDAKGIALATGKPGETLVVRRGERIEVTSTGGWKALGKLLMVPLEVQKRLEVAQRVREVK
jgi:hypothetical protein